MAWEPVLEQAFSVKYGEAGSRKLQVDSQCLLESLLAGAPRLCGKQHNKFHPPLKPIYSRILGFTQKEGREICKRKA